MMRNIYHGSMDNAMLKQFIAYVMLIKTKCYLHAEND